MSKPPKNKIAEILERLQVESWQLELLVSGFAIFLVGNSFEPVMDFARRIQIVAEGLGSHSSSFNLFPLILLGCIFFIFINLILHVIFRGVMD